MKIKDFNFKKLGLTNKRKDYVFNKFFVSRFVPKHQLNKKFKDSFIKDINKKGYVPKDIKEEMRTKTDGSHLFCLYAIAMYLGKNNAIKVGFLENSKLNK
jgi:hypothetical protein